MAKTKEINLEKELITIHRQLEKLEPHLSGVIIDRHAYAHAKSLFGEAADTLANEREDEARRASAA